MTRQEIEAKISTIRNNNALPEKQKGMLLDKYERMLVDATIGDSDAGKIAPAKEKKARAPRKPKTPKTKSISLQDFGRMTGIEVTDMTPKVSSKKEVEPDCDDLFEQDRERKAKAAIAAEKRRNAPKKTEATKNTEAVEKASAKVEKSVEKRIKSGDVSVAEIKKIIEEYETALKKLRQLLTRAEGKMKFGGPVKDQDISKLADKARDISNHHCGCDDKYDGGGNTSFRENEKVRVRVRNNEYAIGQIVRYDKSSGSYVVYIPGKYESEFFDPSDIKKMSDGGSMYAGGGDTNSPQKRFLSEKQLQKYNHEKVGHIDFYSKKVSGSRYSGITKEVYFKDGFRPSFAVVFEQEPKEVYEKLKKWVKAKKENFDDIIAVKYSDGGSMYEGGGESGEMPLLKIVYPTKKSIAGPVSKLMDDLNVDYSSIDFYDTEGGFEAAIIDLNKQTNGAEILSKFEAFEEKHRGDFWLIKLKADGSMYEDGGSAGRAGKFEKGNIFKVRASADRSNANRKATVVEYDVNDKLFKNGSVKVTLEGRNGTYLYSPNDLIEYETGGSMYAGGGDTNEIVLTKPKDFVGKVLKNKKQIGTYRISASNRGTVYQVRLANETITFNNEKQIVKHLSQDQYAGGGGTERDAIEFFTDGGIGMKYIVNGKFDSVKFKNDMITRTSKPNAESTIKGWGKEMGMNVSKYVDGEIIENIDFANDSTKRAKELFEAIKSKYSGGGGTDDTYYGVVDLAGNLMFQSQNESVARNVSKSVAGSIVKKYKGKAKIYMSNQSGSTGWKHKAKK